MKILEDFPIFRERRGFPGSLTALRKAGLSSNFGAERHVKNVVWRMNARNESSSRLQTHWLFFDENAIAVSTRHGLNFDVCGTSPELCLTERACKSSVTPVWKWVPVVTVVSI